MLKYTRFTLVHLWLMGGTIGLYLGGQWMWLGLAVTLTLFVIGDALAGKDLSVPDYKHTWFFNLTLYMALPSLLLMLSGVAWIFGTGDPLNIAPFVEHYTGYDILAARARSTVFDYVGAVFNVALLIVLAGTNVGHELTHRTWDPVSMIIGRWLLAASWDAQFSIEHVYGHHVNIGTPKDPATARRGENVYSFIVRSTIGQIKSAWHLETSRLHKSGRRTWTLRNRVLRGHLMSMTLAAGAYQIGGVTGLGGFLLCAAAGKAGLEIINYLEHYGLVRVEGEPIQPHHSWNTNAKMSGYTLFNLTRHSDHHANGDKPFWKLLPYPDAPNIGFGYITMLLIALIPPLYKRVMASRLKGWYSDHATPEELLIVKQQEKEFGLLPMVPSTV